MAEKKILIKNKLITDISDACPETGGSTDILVSAKGLYDLQQTLINRIITAGGNVIDEINSNLVAGLAEQRLIIDQNTDLISDIDTLVNVDYPQMSADLATKDESINTAETNMVALEEKNIQSIDNIAAITSALSNLATRTFTNITIAGDSDKFYPIWWLFNNTKSCTIVIKKDGTGVGNRGLYLEFIGIGGNEKDGYARSLFIKEFTDKDGISAKLLSLKMYSYEGIGNSINSKFKAHCASGLYLRGNTTYKLYCELQSVKTSIINCVSSGIASLKSVSSGLNTYYMEPISEAAMNTISPDPDLLFENTIKKFILPGDIAVHQGGYYIDTIPMQTNEIQHSSITTAAAAVVTGVLPSIRFRMSATSNGSGDIALAACGGYDIVDSTLKYKSIISTGIDAVSLGSLANPARAIMSTSNGADDISCYMGGGYVGSYNSFIEKTVITTNVDIITSAVLAIGIGNGGCTSNLIHDVGIIVGGQIADGGTGTVTNNVQQFVITTDTNAVITGSIDAACDAGRLVSNGVSDVGMDVESAPAVTYARTIIISTATSCIVSGSINTYGYTLSSQASNSIGDTAVYAGGEAYTDSIRQYTISTPTCTMGTGVLSRAMREVAGTSNG